MALTDPEQEQPLSLVWKCADCATPLVRADGDWICPRCNLPEEAKQEPIPTTEERRAVLVEELRAAWWGQSADWYESVLERLFALEQEATDE